MTEPNVEWKLALLADARAVHIFSPHDWVNKHRDLADSIGQIPGVYNVKAARGQISFYIRGDSPYNPTTGQVIHRMMEHDGIELDQVAFTMQLSVGETNDSRLRNIRTAIQALQAQPA